MDLIEEVRRGKVLDGARTFFPRWMREETEVKVNKVLWD